jgi:hypothetical protein
VLFKSIHKIEWSQVLRTNFLHGMGLAVYIAGQERRLVDPPSQVVAGVRTVTTTMNGRSTLPRCCARSLFLSPILPGFSVVDDHFIMTECGVPVRLPDPIQPSHCETMVPN